MMYYRRRVGVAMTRASVLLNELTYQQKLGQRPSRRDAMTNKNVVVPLEVEYLQAAAKERGVSRTKLVRAVMQKVITDRLVSDLLEDQDLVEAPRARYRRFGDAAIR